MFLQRSKRTLHAEETIMLVITNRTPGTYQKNRAGRQIQLSAKTHSSELRGLCEYIKKHHDTNRWPEQTILHNWRLCQVNHIDVHTAGAASHQKAARRNAHRFLQATVRNNRTSEHGAQANLNQKLDRQFESTWGCPALWRCSFCQDSPWRKLGPRSRCAPTSAGAYRKC